MLPTLKNNQMQKLQKNDHIRFTEENLEFIKALCAMQPDETGKITKSYIVNRIVEQHRYMMKAFSKQKRFFINCLITDHKDSKIF